MTDKPRDPSRMAITVEGARAALRQAGPHSGLHGPAAACMDKGLEEVRDFLNEVGERQKARLAKDVANRTKKEREARS